MQKHRSFWLKQILSEFSPQPKLVGERRFDVVILGGGYVGLWTALSIKKKDPGCSVAILEMDICGGGASGRNGGFVLSWWPKISSLVKLCGQTDGLRVAKDSVDAIETIRNFSEETGSDIEFRKSPWIWTATSRAQLNSWASVLEVCAKLNLPAFRKLPDAEVARRTGSSAHREGVIDDSSATVQPAKLAFALRREALKRGVQIFENTKVLRFSRTNPVRVACDEGNLIAEKLIIANNAWAAGISELSRSIVAITSDMIMTAPAKSQLEKIGWTGGECITDSQTMVDYYHVTKDQRVAFGKGGWGIAYSGNIGTDFDRNPLRAQMVEADFRRYYPSLRDVEVTDDWCGPIDRTPNSLPLLGRFSRQPQIIYGVGWSGNGVGPSVIGGQVLSSLALDRKDEWSEYPLVGRSAGRFPPEPIRFLGAHLVRAAVQAKERREIVDEIPSWLSVKMAGFAPKGLEDKE